LLTFVIEREATFQLEVNENKEVFFLTSKFKDLLIPIYGTQRVRGPKPRTAALEGRTDAFLSKKEKKRPVHCGPQLGE
jgi:hypothetical protein